MGFRVKRAGSDGFLWAGGRWVSRFIGSHEGGGEGKSKIISKEKKAFFKAKKE